MKDGRTALDDDDSGYPSLKSTPAEAASLFKVEVKWK